MRICYAKTNFRPKALGAIAKANAIIAEYDAQGFRLTLRQLYYQFVSRGFIENTFRSYKNLGGLVNDGRLAGLIDWSAIEDRTRNLQAPTHWADPEEIIAASAGSYLKDKWGTQAERVEVWIEKEALSGVFEGVCRRLDVALFPCRGFVSQSEMLVAAQRLIAYEDGLQDTVILYFGDHDPSGIDMTRDVRERLTTFESSVVVERIALTMAQIDQYRPPPNFAKQTDTRFKDYQRQFGDKSWELDALDPATLSALVETNVLLHRDERLWAEAVFHEHERRGTLTAASARWSSVVAHLFEGDE